MLPFRFTLPSRRDYLHPVMDAFPFIRLLEVRIGYQFGAIGFLFAAKSLLRFIDTARAKTEYVLVGTLLSFGIAIISGIIITKLK